MWGKLVVETPSHDKSDVAGTRLNIEMTSEGTLRELKALEYLAVGDVIWKVRHGALIRRRAVARDFAQSVLAAQLGISSFYHGYVLATSSSVRYIFTYITASTDSLLAEDIAPQSRFWASAM